MATRNTPGKPTDSDKDARFAPLVMLSLGLHLLVYLAFAGVFESTRHKAPTQVYRVNLVNLPVERPKAGRPDVPPATKAPPVVKAAPPPKAVPTPSKPAPKKSPVAPKAVTSPKPSATKAPQKVTSPKASAVPAQKPATVTPAPAPSPAKVSPSQEQNLSAALEALQRRQEREQLKAALEKMTAAVTAAPADLGTPEGTGAQAGVSYHEYLREFYRSNWNLSKYQVDYQNPLVLERIEARVSVDYDADGTLTNYRFLKTSGEALFDDSVKKAILREKTLPFRPGRPITEEVVFNLKELME